MKMEKKSGVLTTYPVGNESYGSYITGNSIEEIERKAKVRGLNETILSSLMEVEVIPDIVDLSAEQFREQLPHIIHTACFLSTIALKAGTVTVDDVLGDRGILHELIHINTQSIPVPAPLLEELKLGFSRLRSLTVGVS